MLKTEKNPHLHRVSLPADIVLHPSWWYHNECIVFDEDYFFHPLKRVEVEQKMEQALYERWGKYGLGEKRNEKLPIIGAVHLAAGFIIPQMLGCRVNFKEDSSPEVISANIDHPKVNPDSAFNSEAFKKFYYLLEALKGEYGYVRGDLNWSGILNIALDLRGQSIFLDMFDRPQEVHKFFSDIASVIERFVSGVSEETGTTSISVNRNVRHIPAPIFLHSECSHTMISVEDYEKFLLPLDKLWSERFQPFGIHYCGEDPHRFAQSLAKIPNLDFLDVGWGGQVKTLRQHLPYTFLNIRLSPVEIIQMSASEIKETISKLVGESGNLRLTGVCCINMDHQVEDAKITAILETVSELRDQYEHNPSEKC